MRGDLAVPDPVLIPERPDGSKTARALEAREEKRFSLCRTDTPRIALRDQLK